MIRGLSRHAQHGFTHEVDLFVRDRFAGDLAGVPGLHGSEPLVMGRMSIAIFEGRVIAKGSSQEAHSRRAS
jgi:hypothetical protein